jgi:Uncharacterized protein conserved in bacteria (DUF2325)
MSQTASLDLLMAHAQPQARSLPLPAAFPPGTANPVLVARAPPKPEPVATRRSRIWELNTNLHCSIIGTCLSTGELRQTLAKLGVATPEATDHDLHATAVRLAPRHDAAAKILNKALDQRHKLAIKRFAKARTEQEVQALWRECVAQGEIPGAYWAALTHPMSTDALIREAFGEVHMLSHLVGAANRVDIRRLCELERERTALQSKLERQQIQLRDAVVARDREIQELRRALSARIASEGATAAGVADATLRQLVTDLQRRVNTEIRGRLLAEQRLADLQDEAQHNGRALARAGHELAALREELQNLEAGLRAPARDDRSDVDRCRSLDGLALLYVGGRRHQIARLRSLGEDLGARVLHHDGGLEDSLDLIPGLTSRVDVVLFPVDCVSHAAALTVKRSCRQGGKRFVPLRSSGATSFLAALCRPEMASLASQPS